MRRVCAVVAVLFFASVLAFSQTDASVSGTVTDQTGSAYRGSYGYGADTSYGSGHAGPNQRSGRVYDAVAASRHVHLHRASSGFRKSVTTDVILQVGTILTLNLSLELGQTTESVEVKATAIAVDAPAPRSVA